MLCSCSKQSVCEGVCVCVTVCMCYIEGEKLRVDKVVTCFHLVLCS